MWGSAGPCSLIFRYILGKESLSTRALIASPTMSHGHRPLCIKNKTLLIKQNLTKLQTGWLEGRLTFHRSSKFTDPHQLHFLQTSRLALKVLLSLRVFAGGSHLLGKALLAVWPGLAYALLSPLWVLLCYFEACGTSLSDIQPGTSMSMWKCLSGAAGLYWLSSVWTWEWQHRKGYLILFCARMFCKQLPWRSAICMYSFSLLPACLQLTARLVITYSHFCGCVWDEDKRQGRLPVIADEVVMMRH